MPLDIDTLKLATDKKFTDFSKAVKQELNNKLSNHKVTKKYVSDFDKIQQMKSQFAKIASKDIDKDDIPKDIDKDDSPKDIDKDDIPKGS